MAEFAKIAGMLSRGYTASQWVEFWAKTDIELRTMAVNYATKLLTGTLGNIGISEKMDAERKYKLIEDIQKERARRKTINFDSLLQAKRNDLYMLLKCAYTPIGQLIATILEDEGDKTLDELHTWGEELMSYSEEELSQLLSNLCLDGVLELSPDSKYRLVRICHGDLGFKGGEYKEWALRKREEDYLQRIGKDYDGIVKMKESCLIDEIRNAFFPDDLFVEHCELCEEGIIQGYTDWQSFSLRFYSFVSSGILKYDEYDEYYYRPLLGE